MPNVTVSNTAAVPINIAAAGVDASALSGAQSIAETGGVNFAALLVGQMAAELAQLVKSSAASGTNEAETPIAGADTMASDQITDPSLILTSIGLPPLSPPPATAGVDGTTTAAPDGIALLGDERRPTLEPGQFRATVASNTPAVPGKGDAVSVIPNDNIAAQSANPALQTSPTGEIATPAKLAGFAQKLADAQQPAGPIAAPEAPQASVATSQSPVSNLHRTNEAAHIETPLRQETWPAEFSQKVVWLATHEKQSAQITLNPPDLGPIEITLNLKNDQANAVFSSSHAEVREAIETAIPRLREMFAGVGIELGQANVNSESFRQAQEGQHERGAGSGGEDRGVNEGRTIGPIEVSRPAVRRGNGLVDTFA